MTTPPRTLKDALKAKAKKPPRSARKGRSPAVERAVRSERPDRSCEPPPPGEGRLRDYVAAVEVEIRTGLRVCQKDGRPSAVRQAEILAALLVLLQVLKEEV